MAMAAWYGKSFLSLHLPAARQHTQRISANMAIFIAPTPIFNLYIHLPEYLHACPEVNRNGRQRCRVTLLHWLRSHQLPPVPKTPRQPPRSRSVPGRTHATHALPGSLRLRVTEFYAADPVHPSTTSTLRRLARDKQLQRRPRGRRARPPLRHPQAREHVLHQLRARHQLPLLALHALWKKHGDLRATRSELVAEACVPLSGS